MYYVMRASAPSLHRESTDSLIMVHEFKRLHHLMLPWILKVVLRSQTLGTEDYAKSI